MPSANYLNQSLKDQGMDSPSSLDFGEFEDRTKIWSINFHANAIVEGRLLYVSSEGMYAVLLPIHPESTEIREYDVKKSNIFESKQKAEQKLFKDELKYPKEQ